MIEQLFTPTEINALYEHFEPHEHEVREAYKKDGYQYWFVYIKRGAIQLRLDRLFPGQWSNEVIGEPRQYDDKVITVTMSLTIRGIVRTQNGSNKAKPEKRGAETLDYENTEKAAMTDAFKRAASMWGIGMYLQSWTVRTGLDGTTKDALAIVAGWLKKSTPAHDDGTGEIIQGNDDDPVVESADSEKTSQNGSGEQSEMFTGQTDSEHPDIETNIVSVTVIEKIKGGSTQKYIKCSTEAGMNVTAWTRSTFTEKGYNEAEDWTVVNQQYTPVLPIPITLKYDGDTGFYQLEEVKSLGVKNDPKAISPQAARFKAGA